MSNSPKDAHKLDNDSIITKEGNIQEKENNRCGTILNKEGMTNKELIGEQEQVYKNLRMNTINGTHKTKINGALLKQEKNKDYCYNKSSFFVWLWLMQI